MKHIFKKLGKSKKPKDPTDILGSSPEPAVTSTSTIIADSILSVPTAATISLQAAGVTVSVHRSPSHR